MSVYDWKKTKNLHSDHGGSDSIPMLFCTTRVLIVSYACHVSEKSCLTLIIQPFDDFTLILDPYNTGLKLLLCGRIVLAVMRLNNTGSGEKLAARKTVH
jgi:hypothetical protein